MVGESDNLPPRVLPLLVNELATTTSAARYLHLAAFMKRIPAIFKIVRVVDEDVADLFVALCSIARSPKSFEKPPSAGATGSSTSLTAYIVVQVLLELLNVRKEHSAQCLRVVKRLFDRLAKKRDEGAENRSGSWDQLHRGASSLGNRLEDTTSRRSEGTTNDASTIDASAILPLRNNLATPAGLGEDDDDLYSFVRSAESPQAATALHIEGLLSHDATRAAACELYLLLDRSGCDISLLTSKPHQLHLFFPQRMTSNVKVYRDFAFCTQRPKLTKEWGSVASVHIKTNIKKKSEVMYRILVEGYNYGVNAPIFADVVGYTNRNWDELGKMSRYGWPEGWDDTATNEYAPGAAISQYFSQDDFVVVRLQAKSMFSVGFSVSAWLCFHRMGNGFPITATIHHQDVDL